jgi:hypothetical protein
MGGRERESRGRQGGRGEAHEKKGVKQTRGGGEGKGKEKLKRERKGRESSTPKKEGK